MLVYVGCLVLPLLGAAQAEEPAGPPLFVMDYGPFAEVRVHQMVMPDPVVGHAECEVLFQVNSQLKVWAWPEDDCASEVVEATTIAAAQWVLAPGEIERNERHARFRATFEFGDGAVQIVVPERELVTPIDALPEGVTSAAPAETVKRVRPKLAAATDLTCTYQVEVDRRGRPAGLAPIACPESLQPAAERALERWRWSPATVSGRPQASLVQVRVQFRT